MQNHQIYERKFGTESTSRTLLIQAVIRYNSAHPIMSIRTRIGSELLARIVSFYLGSDDFNGISLQALVKDGNAQTLAALKALVARGDVEALSEEAVNPHIKRLPAPPIPKQLSYFANDVMVCFYPSIKYMVKVLPGNLYRQRPFTRLLALGHPQLEPIFFQLGVLERYQSDPRYVFRFDGLDGHISVKEKPYRSRDMGDADKVMLETFGLGTSSKGQRVITSYPRYLSALSPRHQQHWQSHRAYGQHKMEANYARRGLFGEWTKGVSIYDALLQELLHINKLCNLIGLPALFRNDFSTELVKAERNVALDEPKGFGLLMKPTKKAFLDFAHVLDKVVSENINREFFAAQGIELEERQTSDGHISVTNKGTLRLLEEWLAKRIRIHSKNGPAVIVAPLKEVRNLRQAPAHKFIDDEFSIQYQSKKEKLILDVYISISNIRMFFQTHPRARNYEFPEHLKPENIVVF